MSPLKTWHILGVTKSFLFPPLLLEPPCSFVLWVWSLLVLGLPSGRIMDPLFSLLMQSPALSPPYKCNQIFSDVGESLGKILRESKSSFWSHCWDPGRALGGLLGHRPCCSWVNSLVQPQPITVPREMPHAWARLSPLFPQLLCFWLEWWDGTKQAAVTYHLCCLFLSLCNCKVTLDYMPCIGWKYFKNGNESIFKALF